MDDCLLPVGSCVLPLALLRWLHLQGRPGLQATNRPSNHSMVLRQLEKWLC